ncbi:DUF2780 domain-containing protein [Montanilutibacter psychrotolerans]|uniref:DUF2780 domain-containing protein n=1 Tax=Montanilutibacter psychrotolerans TaxID=1327343 RepID=A0A3M8SQZ5_9GAMM|nr:DUF2780 domain-containing protein [Lysobacter psychrotolerans]RNF83125.1 DUF2780 domain-containing protein [Lysobacter psychrotolerans]
MDLVQMLVSQLGINDQQARGGTGLLLKLAQDRLAGSEFASLANAVPGAADLIAAAPGEDDGGLMGALGGLLGGQAGDLMTLANGFSKLGVDLDTARNFLPVITGFLGEKGDGAAQAVLAKLLGR